MPKAVLCTFPPYPSLFRLGVSWAHVDYAATRRNADIACISSRDDFIPFPPTSKSPSFRFSPRPQLSQYSTLLCCLVFVTLPRLTRSSISHGPAPLFRFPTSFPLHNLSAISSQYRFSRAFTAERFRQLQRRGLFSGTLSRFPSPFSTRMGQARAPRFAATLARPVRRGNR